MNETSMISIFNSPEFGQVRTVTIDGEPWFVGRDVASALGYSNGRDAIARHVDERDKADVVIHDGSQNRSVTAINESGLYALVLSSKLPTAKEFQHWVTSEVLPSVRITGGYMTPAMTMQLQTLLASQQDLLSAQQARLDKLEHYVVKIGKNLNYTNYFLLREFGSGTKSGWKDTVSARLKVIEDATSISGLDQLRNVYLYMGRKYGVDWEQYGDMYKKVHGSGKVSTLDIVCDSELLMGKFDEALTELFGRLELPLPEIPEPKLLDGEADPFDELVARVKKRRAVAQEFRSNRSASAAV